MKKKTFPRIIITVLVLFLFWAFPMGASASDFPYGISATDQYPFDGGDGTSEDPYLISTPQQLAQLAYNVDQDMNYQGEYIKVTANIDLAGLDWVPIGTSATEEFMGHFDGNDKIISNLSIGSVGTPCDLEEVGLFGYLYHSDIHNVIIENAAIYSSIPDDYGDIGVLAGEVISTIISFCSASGSITASSDGGSYVGGLVGSMDSGTNSQLIGCTAAVNINVSSGSAGEVGGLIGEAGCDVISCSASGTVSGYGYLGGLVGNSKNIVDSYATGNVSSTYCGGGLVGCNEYFGQVKNSYATGSVYGQNDAGGLVGYSDYYSQVINSYATGNVNTVLISSDCGGLVGSCSGDIINCYASGQVTNGSGLVDDLYAGGTYPAAVVTNCYWNNSLNATGGAGTGLTTGLMQANIFLIYLNDPTLENRDETYRDWIFVSGVNNDMPVLNNVGVGMIDPLPIISNTDSAHNLADEAEISFESSTLGQFYYACVASGSEIPVINTTGSGTLCYEGTNEYTISAAAGTWDIYVVVKDLNGIVSTPVKIELAAEPALFAGGNGTADDPYQIAAPYHLYNVRYYLSSYFILTDNIDLDPAVLTDAFWYDQTIGWRAIGGSDYLEATFTGDFNGNGKTISNLHIGSLGDSQSEYDFCGLFGYMDTGGKIYDLSVTDMEIYSTNKASAGIVASSYGTVDHCYTSGLIKVNNSGSAGGIAGNNYINAVIKNCCSDVNIQDDCGNAGGFVGYNQGNIYNCGATGNVDGGSWSYVGGFVGQNMSYHGVANIVNCYAAGNVSDSAGGYLGPFYGYNYETTSFNDCYYNDDAAINIISGTPNISTDLNGIHAVSFADMQSTNFVGTLNDGIPGNTGYYIWTLVSGLNNDYPVLSNDLADFTAPTIDDAEIDATDTTENSVILTWAGAADNVTSSQNLLYRLYRSSSDNIDTVTDIEANGTPVTDFGAINTYTVTGLDSSTAYYFNIIVKDEAGNKTAYDVKSVTTADPTVEHYPSEKFTDVDTSLWYREGIDFVVVNGLFKGTSETTFSPDVNMTRAMLVTVLWRLEGEPASDAANSFTDISAGKWYTNAVIWASEHEIVSGYNANTFGPNDPVTREQMVTILYRYATYKEYDTSSSASLSNFTDAGKVSNWAATAVKWAVADGLIIGVTDTKLDPGGKATRAQVATILMRFVGGEEG